jgi:hypothetical protein
MTPDINYSEARGYNLGIARDMGLNAAVTYNQLCFWQGIVGKGKWFYKSYEEMTAELPLSIKQLRNAYQVLEENGMIETDKRKVAGAPTLHFRVYMRARFGNLEVLESDKSARTKDSDKKSQTINNKENTSMVADATPEQAFDGKSEGQQATPASQLLGVIIAIINPREKPTADRMRNLNARLKEYSGDEIVAAAHALSKSAWHKENNQMSVDNLIRASKFGRWFQEATKNTPNYQRAYTGPTSAPKKVWGDEDAGK